VIVKYVNVVQSVIVVVAIVKTLKYRYKKNHLISGFFLFKYLRHFRQRNHCHNHIRELQQFY